MKTARFLSFLGALVLGLLLVHPAGAASILQSAKLSLSDSRPGTSANHTFSFTTSTAESNLQAIEVYYCKEASYGAGCTRPAGLSLTSVTGGDLSNVSGINAQWTLANNEDDWYYLVLNRPTAGQNVVANSPVSFTVNGITNPSIAGCNANGVNTSTGTCYAHISTFNNVSSAGTLVDSAVVSLTVVDAVTVTARIDPTFTFVVRGVGASTTNNGVTTSVSTAYNTLPFGNLAANVPKYAAHELTVTTNTQSGYTVAIKMVTQMTGVYTANNIDPFVPTAGNHSTWPASHPSGTTPNDNTGWIGYNTDDNDVAIWSGVDSAEFAGVSSASEATVMQKTSSDNGSVPNFVSYGIEVNVYQPSDTYTGTLYYNALPTY